MNEANFDTNLIDGFQNRTEFNQNRADTKGREKSREPYLKQQFYKVS